jgi:hypothetical protein
MQPWEAQGVIECGKVAVRPGDAIVGDQDGVVCVPAAVAQQVCSPLAPHPFAPIRRRRCAALRRGVLTGAGRCMRSRTRARRSRR